ncbi:MAG: hypothetical protein M3020_26710 [Myxococcota bacterium]|jgi:hypothetical protein|nr:hypothetical protein [Myxococcota bacterium]
MEPPVSYETSVALLLDRFPEFESSGEKWYRDIPSDAFGTFSLFLRRRIERNDQDDLVRRAFEFFNELARTANDEVINLLETSVFEILVDHPQSWLLAERHLSDAALQSWRRMQTGGLVEK